MKNREIEKHKIIMSVFNYIEYDGRVQRSAEGLSEIGDVSVFCLDSGNNYHNGEFKTDMVEVSKNRLLKHFKFWMKFIYKVLQEKPDIVYCHDYYLALPGWVASKLSKAKYVYDAHELIIPEKKKKGSRGNFFYQLEKLIVNKADVVIAANQERAKLMEEHYGLSVVPLVIKNIPPMNKEVESISSELRSKLSKNTFKLVYQGDVNKNRGVELFIDVMEKLNDYYELIIIGDGPHKLELEQKVQNNNILTKKVSFLGKVERIQLMPILKECDIGVVTYSNLGLNNIYCAPNKIYEYTQAELPVITTNQQTIKKILQEYRIGEVINLEGPQNFEQLVAAIKWIEENLSFYNNNIKHFLEENTWIKEKVKLTECVLKL